MNIESLYEKFLQSGEVSTDTRKITPGSVFIALKGPHYNANAFALEALQKGAGYAVVDEPLYAQHPNTILVDDGLKTLQQLARHHRNQLHLPVIGLTGSNGKTTSKELIHDVLSCKYKTYATQGNLNNHIGVPLTVLAIKPSTEIAVVEMGANHVGEIAQLSEIARPTHGLITNIGKAHIGTFGGFDNIVKAKSELYDFLIQNKGEVFINSRNPILAGKGNLFAYPHFYPARGDYYEGELLTADPFIKLRAQNGEVVTTHLIGAYNFENIAAALCIGKYFEVNPRSANKAVAEYQPKAMRSQIIQKGSNMIILDAYNANPSSMEAAIENLAQMKSARKIAILGDMYELEDESEKEHRRLGELLVKSKIEEVYLCGELIRDTLATYPSASYFKTKRELIQRLREQQPTNATILIKASRGMALESVVDAL